jgi:O-antigen ligase
MLNLKLKIYFILIISINVIIIPQFFDIDIEAKFIFFFSGFLLFFIFHELNKIQFVTLIILIFGVILCSLNNKSGLLSFKYLIFFTILWIFVEVSRDLFSRYRFESCNYFFNFYLFFIVFVSAFGLYEYYDFFLLGKSNGMLIPYFLPENVGIRVGGIYGQPNIFSLSLLVGLIVFLYQHLHSANFSNCRFPKLTYLPFLTVALTFFLTGSRAGLLGLSLTYLPLCWLVVRKRYLTGDADSRRKFLHLSCALLLAYGLSYALNYFAASEAVRGLGEIGVPAEARFVFWTSAILIFLDHPWFGVGLDNYQFYLPKYVNQAHDLLGFVQYEAMGYTKWAHNELLHLLCEGGIFVFLVVVFLLGCFFYQLYLYAVGRKQWSPLKLYSHLFLLPFILQSMFCWPMRHPALLVLFFTFLGLLLSQYPYKTVIVPPWGRVVMRGVVLCGLVIILLVGHQELRMGSLAHNMDRENVQASFPEFVRLAAHPYSEYPLLLKITPRFVQAALQDKDVEFAEQILPYVKKLVDLQGAHWQWYNLGLVYHLLEREDEAKQAATQAIRLRPTNDDYWSFQHYLNILTAAKKTGRSLEEFISKSGGDVPVSDIREMLNFDDCIKFNM